MGSVRPTRHGLNVHLNLRHQVEDRRVTQSEPLTKKLTFHRFMLRSPDDLDEQFTTWINEAHDAAKQRPLGDPPQGSSRNTGPCECHDLKRASLPDRRVRQRRSDLPRRDDVGRRDR